MAKQSGYIKRKKVEIGVCRQAEKETYIQFMSDMFQIALNDPDVMGKDVLGEDRIKCVVEAAGRNFDTFHGALENIPEADYFQEKLDSRLGRIFKEKTGALCRPVSLAQEAGLLISQGRAR